MINNNTSFMINNYPTFIKGLKLKKGDESVIVVEGNIGVGKTTLSKAIRDKYNMSLFKEISNPLTQFMLDKFYVNKSRYAFLLQVHFLNERFKMIKEIFKNEGGILDRSIYGDRIFAEVLHNDGNMDEYEYKTYCSLLNNMLEHVKAPRILIYLSNDPLNSIRKIKERGIPSEQSIPLDYLQSLKNIYDKWYDEYELSPKIKLDYNTLDLFKEEDREIIFKKIDEKLNLI